MKKSRRLIFGGITVTALGVVVIANASESYQALGVVLIAVGGLFFITGMSEKKKEDENEKT